jgi:hypothetical protein
MLHSRPRLGWWLLSAWLLNPQCCRCSVFRSDNPLLAGSRAGSWPVLSVIVARGILLCLLSGSRGRCLAACVLVHSQDAKYHPMLIDGASEGALSTSNANHCFVSGPFSAGT